MVKNKYKIERKYISNKLARSKQKNNGVKFLVAHETANNTANADTHYTYFNNITFEASAHTFIDDGKILEIIPLDEKAWHVQRQQDKQVLGLGAANDHAIGTELCRPGNFSKAYDRYVWYHAYLCKKYGLQPKKHIVSHKVLDPQRRSDPQSWLSPNGVTWDQFIKDVQTYFDQWEGKSNVAKPKPDKPTPAPEPKPSEYKGDSIVDYLKSIGVNSSASNRKKLAKEYGVKNYDLSANKNTELLNAMQKGKPAAKPEKPSTTVKVGDKVTLSKSAKKYVTGQTIPARIKGKSYTVQQIKGNQVLLKEIVSWVYLSDVGGSVAKPKPKSFKTGQKVKIKSSAKKYSRANVTIPARHKNKTHTIQQVGKNDVLIKELVSWVKKTDVQ